MSFSSQVKVEKLKKSPLLRFKSKKNTIHFHIQFYGTIMSSNNSIHTDFIQIMNVQYDESHPILDYLYSKNNKEDFKRIFLEDSDSKYASITSKMSNGKTYSTLLMAIENKVKLVLLVPLRILGTQTLKAADSILQTNTNNSVGLVMGGNNNSIGNNFCNPNDIQEAIDRGIHIFICVYESLNKLLETETFNTQEYILVIDEAHNLVSQYDFRSDAINRIANHMEKFKKIIFMTATPEIVLPEEFHTIKKIEFTKETQGLSARIPLKLVHYGDNPIELVALEAIKDCVARGQKKIILLLDNKENLLFIYNNLIHIEKLNEDSVGLLFANPPEQFKESTEKLMSFIIENEKTPDNLQVLLSTRVFSDGVNIKEFVDSIILMNVREYHLKRQFIGRFRLGVGEIFDFHPKLETQPFVGLKKEEIIKELLSLAQNELSSYKTRRELQTHLKNINSKRFEYLVKFDNSYHEFISWPAIYYKYYEDFNKKLHTNQGALTTFYKEFCNFEVSIRESPPDSNDVESQIGNIEKIRQSIEEFDYTFERKMIDYVFYSKDLTLLSNLTHSNNVIIHLFKNYTPIKRKNYFDFQDRNESDIIRLIYRNYSYWTPKIIY